MNRTSISDLKAKAKDQLLGNYKMATGSFALLFVLLYAIMSVVMSAISISAVPAILIQLAGILIASLSTIFTVGYIYILRSVANGGRPVISDLFYVFRNHPDKIIIISLITGICQFILLLPADHVQKSVFTGDIENPLNGRMFLIWVLLYLAGFIISFIIQLMLAMCYMIYLDDPEIPVMSCIRGSISMMKGNKFRYFYMILSFIGYWLLVIMSLGIAALFVAPYQIMTTLNFYDDIKNEGLQEERYNGDFFR